MRFLHARPHASLTRLKTSTAFAMISPPSPPQPSSGSKMNNARKPCIATVFGHFLFCIVPKSYQFTLSACYHNTYSVSISAISVCLFEYKCEYVLRVVFISSCPNRSLIESGETPNSIKWLA